MGSLMSGWGSIVQDPTAVKYQRNHSLTRDEIDSYWKSKKKKEELHNEIVSEETGRVEKSDERSRCVPVCSSKERVLDMGSDDSEGSLEKLILQNGWWMGSNSAFLNEPPVLLVPTRDEGGEHEYKKSACGRYGSLRASTCLNQK